MTPIHGLHGDLEIGLQWVVDGVFPWSLLLLGSDGTMTCLNANGDALRKRTKTSVLTVLRYLVFKYLLFNYLVFQYLVFKYLLCKYLVFKGWRGEQKIPSRLLRREGEGLEMSHRSSHDT